MPPMRRAGNSAYVEKYTKASGEQGLVIHCRLCAREDRRWSTRLALKRLLGGKRFAKQFGARADAMDLWTVHMQVHHSDLPQPDWRLSEDVDAEVFDCEAQFFEPRKWTAEEKMLREIFAATEN